MRIPENTPNEQIEKAVFGYLVTMTFIAVMGYFYQPILTGLMYFVIITTIGVFVMPLFSPYYLTWSSGASMMPSIPIGLTLILSSERYNTINVGDVVTYKIKQHNMVVRHRIVGKNGDKYIVKGDSNEKRDPHDITEEQIKHKTIQYGYQPIYIPISPLAIFGTIIKIYKKLNGET